MEESGVPGENHRPWASNWYISFIACGCESSAPIFIIYKAGREHRTLTTEHKAQTIEHSNNTALYKVHSNEHNINSTE